MSSRFRAAAVIVLLAGTVLSGQNQPAQTPQGPTFRVQIDYVEVDVLVTDERGNFVRDLKKEDFQVMEDGKPKAISAFSIVDIPVERFDRPLYAPTPLEPDVKTNAEPFNGRVYVMVIDDLHTNFGRSPRVKSAARQFIQRHLAANDLMAVVHTMGPTSANQEFTNNKRLLLAAVDRTMGNKVRSSTVLRTDVYNTQASAGREAGDPVGDPADAERAFNARNTLITLRNVAEWFGNVHGRRKAILFMSEGIDYDITQVIPTSSASPQRATVVLDETREVIAAATKANVAIYGIDPRGLTGLGDETIEVQAFPDDSSLGIGPQSVYREIRLAQDSLRTLSDNTGGFAVVNQNDFATAYDRLVKDNSAYYVLAYYPPNPKRDGKYHRIDVRVTRPGLVVRARKGYSNPKGKPPAALSFKGDSLASAETKDALSSPLPVSGLTMQAFAAPFKGAQPNASVLVGVELRGRDLGLDGSGKVNLTFLAVDPEGKIRGGNTTGLTLNLKPETRARVEQTGIRTLDRVELPPGRYQLRVAAHDSARATVGSVLYDLEVPDFNKPPIATSGLVITSAFASMVPTARPDEQLKAVLPGPPVGLRAFPQNDEVVVFLEVYDNETSPHRVDITTTVTSDDGRVVFKNDEERSSADLGGKRGGYGYTTRIPMRDVAPGDYVLKVEARSRLGSGASAAREVRISVTPPSPRS
jgi:VWFA-related protein